MTAQVYTIRTTLTAGEWVVTSAEGCVVLRSRIGRKPAPRIRAEARAQADRGLAILAGLLGEPIECHPDLWRPLVNPGPIRADEMDNTILA